MSNVKYVAGNLAKKTPHGLALEGGGGENIYMYNYVYIYILASRGLYNPYGLSPESE